MSEKLVKVLEKEGKRIITSTSENMEDAKQRAIQDMKAKIKEITEALKIQPLKGAAEVIELLERGGIIKTKTVDVEWDNTVVELNVGGRRFLYETSDIRLNKGKYRFTLIIEPMEAET